MQIGGLSRAEGGRFHNPGRHDAVSAAGVRAVFEASSRRLAYRVYEAEATGYRTFGVQCGASANITRPGGDPAGSE